MPTNVEIKKTVFPKDSFDKRVNNSFSTYTAEKPVADRTIEQFFQDYENLYFQIPPEGVSASHRYLVNKSTEVLTMEQETLNIQPLLDEVASLQEQLLASKLEYINAQQKIAELTLQLK